MKKMIVQRLLHLVVVLFLVTLVSFFLMYFSPGDPVTALLSRGGTVPDPDVVAQKRAELGLDRPVAEQYVAWLAGIFQGNLGTSISSGRPVASEIAARMPATLFLAVTSLALTLVVSIPLGCLCALKKNRATDLIIRFASFPVSAVWHSHPIPVSSQDHNTLVVQTNLSSRWETYFPHHISPVFSGRF
jgi:peptide/nickel transport system permease protein